MSGYGEKQREIAKEFGKSFMSVILGFADDGYSIHATAGIIGYAQSSFRRLCKRHGIDGRFARGQSSVAAKMSRKDRKGRPGFPETLEAMRDNNPGYKRITYNGITDTLAGHARRLGIPEKTARNRYYRRGEDWGYVFSVVSHTQTPSTKGHHWRIK